MKITKLQREMLEHRLEVYDCIAEALGVDDVDVFVACSKLLKELKGDKLPVPESELEKEVLADAVNGSTWIGAMIGERPESQISRHITQGEKLAEMVEEVTGIETECPVS